MTRIAKICFCGLPMWLYSTAILSASITANIILLFCFIFDPQAVQYFLDALKKFGEIGVVLLLVKVIFPVLDVNISFMALWGIINRKECALLAYMSWSIVVMISLAYVIYLVIEEITFPKELYNTMTPYLAWLPTDHQRNTKIITASWLSLPIVIKSLMTLIIYKSYQIIVNENLRRKQVKFDRNDINILIQEAIISHMKQSI